MLYGWCLNDEGKGYGLTALRVSTVDRTFSNVASDSSDICNDISAKSRQSKGVITHSITSLSSHGPHLLFLLFPLLIIPSEWQWWRRRTRTRSLILRLATTSPMCSWGCIWILTLVRSGPVHFWTRSGQGGG